VTYTAPTPADLQQRYPAFADVDTGTITWWLNYVVGKDVDQSWGENTGPEGHMAAAAGRMFKAGVKIAGSDVAGMAASGVTDFKSGTFQARFSDDAVKQAISNDWADTTYGADYDRALNADKGGPRVTAPGHVPCDYGFVGLLSPHRYC
jgi:hypothetical protein